MKLAQNVQWSIVIIIEIVSIVSIDIKGKCSLITFLLPLGKVFAQDDALNVNRHYTHYIYNDDNDPLHILYKFHENPISVSRAILNSILRLTTYIDDFLLFSFWDFQNDRLFIFLFWAWNSMKMNFICFYKDNYRI